MTNTKQTALDTTHVTSFKNGTRMETTWHDTLIAAMTSSTGARKRGADTTREFAQPTSCLGRYRAVAFWTVR